MKMSWVILWKKPIKNVLCIIVDVVNIIIIILLILIITIIVIFLLFFTKRAFTWKIQKRETQKMQQMNTFCDENSRDH